MKIKRVIGLAGAAAAAVLVTVGVVFSARGRMRV